MSGSDVSSAEVGRDDGPDLRMVTANCSDTNLNVTARLAEIQEKSPQFNDYALSMGDDDLLVAAIKEASFIPTLGDVGEPELDLSFSSVVHASTPFPGRGGMGPPDSRPHVFHVPPTPFNSMSTSTDTNHTDISDLIVITSALEEEGYGLQIGQEIALEVGQEPDQEKMQDKMPEAEVGQEDIPNPTPNAVTNKRKLAFNPNRKDVCKGMSTEQVEKLSSDKKITEYKRPKTVYDKEVRRRDKLATNLSMLRQVVPGITEKTDNTAVFEMASSYIIFLKSKVGDKEHDKLFLKSRMPF